MRVGNAPSIGVVVLHHDRSVVEQVAETLEADAGVFVAATSLEAGARASVVIAGGEPLYGFEPGALPLVALAEDEPVRSARAAIAAGARDIVRWPEEAARLVAAARSASKPLQAPRGGAPIVAVYGSRGGLGTSTLVAMLAAWWNEALVIDLDGGQRTFGDLNVAPARMPVDVDADVVSALAVGHVGTSRVLHLGEQIQPSAARGLFRAARQVAAAVLVDAGRHPLQDVDRSILVTGCDVSSVHRAKAMVGEDTYVVMRRTRYSLGKRDVTAALGRVDLLVPDDPAVIRAADLGRLPSKGNRTMRAAARLARALQEHA